MKHIDVSVLEVMQEAVDLLKKYPESPTVVKEQCSILVEYSKKVLADIRFNSKRK